MLSVCFLIFAFDRAYTFQASNKNMDESLQQLKEFFSTFWEEKPKQKGFDLLNAMKNDDTRFHMLGFDLIDRTADTTTETENNSDNKKGRLLPHNKGLTSELFNFLRTTSHDVKSGYTNVKRLYGYFFKHAPSKETLDYSQEHVQKQAQMLDYYNALKKARNQDDSLLLSQAWESSYLDNLNLIDFTWVQYGNTFLSEFLTNFF